MPWKELSPNTSALISRSPKRGRAECRGGLNCSLPKPALPPKLGRKDAREGSCKAGESCCRGRVKHATTHPRKASCPLSLPLVFGLVKSQHPGAHSPLVIWHGPENHTSLGAAGLGAQSWPACVLLAASLVWPGFASCCGRDLRSCCGPEPAGRFQGCHCCGLEAGHFQALLQALLLGLPSFAATSRTQEPPCLWLGGSTALLWIPCFACTRHFQKDPCLSETLRAAASLWQQC